MSRTVAQKTGLGTTEVQAPVVDAVCDAFREQLEGDRCDRVVAFTRLFFAKASPEFFEDRTTEDVAALALDAFEFLQESRPDRVDIRIFNPGPDAVGWPEPVTVLRTNISERPFIVDTLREYLNARELVIERFLYPVMKVVRAPDGNISEIAPAADGPPRESLIHCEISRVAEQDELERIREELRSNLQDVVRATEDFGAMLEVLDGIIRYLEERADEVPNRRGELDEIQDFLRWLRDGEFVFLGYRGYDLIDDDEHGRMIVTEPGSGLGVLRNEAESAFAEPVPMEELPRGLRERVEGGPLLIISKTNALSTVHRRVRMDYIGVKKLDSSGRIVGEHRFLGLFTSQAFSEDAEQIPILRGKLRDILEQAGAIQDSHDYKEIITIFNSMPKEQLFLTSAEEIGGDVQAALTLHAAHEVKVTLRPDPLERGLSIMVIMPREKFSGEVRKAVEDAFVERLGGEVLNYHLALGGGDQARLHFYMAVPAETARTVTPDELENLVRALIRSWVDRVGDHLIDVRSADQARRLARRYGEAFSPEYKAATDPDVAAEDILELESMEASGRSIAISLSNSELSARIAVGEAVTELKVYLRDQRLVLSDFMPILENAGLRVIAVSPFEVIGPDVPSATIYVFAVQDSAGEPLDVVERGDGVSEAILAVRAGQASDDSLNALVLGAGLSWREVDVLRAYSEYAFQLGAVPSRLSLRSALREYPGAARLLIELFATKFDPGLERSHDDRARATATIHRDFVRWLERVSSLADDRALRRLLVLVDATVRTNYYMHGADRPVRTSGGAPYISLKFSCDLLRSIVRSRLRYEVWVHSARMSGVHLRGAMVARGGIRHSDRPDDFRTEVLGLVKTQMVKNAVIVPGGSKGGFILQRKLSGREEMAEEVKEQYQTLMRGLLDITDNLVDGEVVEPEGVIAYDDPDPYLVVAADKGTAHLSDVANAVAAEYRFWLEDAFASGGSHGYDHKKVGITARGAWESVRRHFREMGTDIQAEPFTVVGIGDMSGDVFGNGMLLSKHIRLVAAFDHRHVFIDPDPDAASSYRERQRLFEAGRTSWADYDTSLLSEGGFVVPRSAKEVELPEQARRALGLPSDTEVLNGEALIQAVLRAPVDLLWNGGIGTYVKSAGESQSDVGDSANDAVRINADELRVKVIGEGGNLGLTQAARIEYARRGGRLNTDALDNSGGVDMSDREVNLKILFNGAITEGRLDRDERNQLLEELTESVTELVLRDNRSQSLAVSLDEQRARRSIEDFVSLMSRLERMGLLDRAAEGLPTSDELEETVADGGSLTRPELSVLLAYSKLSLKQHLLASGLPDDPAAESYLVDYFPAKAVEAAGREQLAEHRLRREIVASQLTNDLVDLMGSSFVTRVARDTGHDPAAVARSWLVAARLSDTPALMESLREVEYELPTPVVYRWVFGLTRVLERTSRWVLGNVEADASTAVVIEEHLAGLGTLRDHFGELVTGEDRRRFESLVGEIQELTNRYDLAQRLITLRFLDQLMEILRVARENDADYLRAGQAYYLTSELLGIPWLRQAIFEAAGEDRWDQRAAQALADDLGRGHRDLTGEVLAEGSETDPVEMLMERVRTDWRRELANFHALVDEVREEDRPSLAALSIAIRELQTLGVRL